MPSDPSPPNDLYAELLGLPAPAPSVAAETLEIELAASLEGDVEDLAWRLQGAGVRDLQAALAAVRSLAEDPMARDRFAAILALLLDVLPRCADPDMALRNLDRFARASLDRVALYGALLDHPVLVRFLSDLLSFSEFLSDILIRNPEYFEWLLTPDLLDADAHRQSFRDSLAHAVAPFRKIETLRRVVCRWKRRELLRIGVRDMLGKASILQCARELAWIADAVLQIALDQTRAQCDARFGPARSEFAPPDAPPTQFTIYAMGKLGGEDLNFSSDIDLIFVYAEEGRTAGVADATGVLTHQITNHEYFTKLGERIIAFLGEPSDEGMLFRVDMRLRPEGKTGPLARAMASYTAYFADQAQLWEKAAYLKARCAAGGPELARQFDECVAHFVFSDVDPATLDADLVHLKQRIDQEVLEGDERLRDLKRGLGGIREIEFIAARHQLREGGRVPALRTRNTPEALERLAEHGALDPAAARSLLDAYQFLRRLEHRLQMMAERQTYLVPESIEDFGRLARRAGDSAGSLEEAGRRLQAKFQTVTKTVRSIFLQVFGLEAAATPPPKDTVRLLLRPESDSEWRRASQLLTDHGFREPAPSLKSLQELAYGSADVAVTSTGQRWFERILPALLEAGPRLPFPDAAVRSLDLFLRASKARALYYQLLAENPPFLRMLLAAFGAGPVLSRSLIAHPEWFDEFLETGAVAPGFDVAAQEPRVRSEGMNAPDDEAAWRRLRRWKEKTALVLGLLEVLGLEREERLAQLTADLADICLRAVAERVERGLTTQLGAPRAGDAGEGRPLRWAVLGLGGFGGRHVSHFSDLDIVLLYSEKGYVPGPNGVKASHWFSRLGEELIAVMTAVSPEGQLFRVDARLRPEGRNAPLAATLDRYVSYYQRDAQTWEWQAILKARRIAGDDALASEFLSALWEREPARFPDIAALATEVRAMRERLDLSAKIPRWAAADFKRGQGGLVDIDFIVQFLQLKTMTQSHAAARARLAQPVLPLALKALVEVGALTPDDAAALREEHEFLRTLQRRARLLFETSKDFFPEKEDRLDPLRRALAPRLGEGVDLVPRFRDCQHRLRDLFDRLVR